MSVGLSRRRSRVRAPSLPPTDCSPLQELRPDAPRHPTSIGALADGLPPRCPPAHQNESPFAVSLATGVGIAVAQQVVEAFSDLRPREMFGAAGKACQQPLATGRLNHNSAARC